MSTSPSPSPSTPLVVVTGANGLVGSRVCAALVERGATVRAVVRRAGTAPTGEGISEVVGEFDDAVVAAAATRGADAVVATVHPMGSDLATQERIGVKGTATLARAAAEAGVARFVHVSTAAVYDRAPGAGDIDESAALIDDDGGDYAVTKRDTEAALAEVDGLTRVLLRPPAILGASESSVWNTLRPAAMREDAAAREGVPDQTWPWIHVDDLAALAADVATGAVTEASDAAHGPVSGGCTTVNVVAEPATMRDYVGTVTTALGVDPVWTDRPAWTGQLLSDRARGWGWTPQVSLADALEELAAGLSG